MNPMRFYLVFDVEGNASEQLSRLSTQFIELGAAGTAAGGGVQSFHGTVIAAIHGLRQLEEVGHGATQMGYGLLHVLGELAGSVSHNAQEFEALRARMGFAFPQDAARVWEQAQTYAVESVYNFREVADVVNRLGIAIPGLSTEFSELHANYRSRTGQMIDAFHVLGDTAAGTNRSLTMVSYEAMQMMAGVWRGAHQVLHLTHQETDQIKHAIASTTDTAVQFSSIMQVLASHYGGATSAMQNTLEFLRMQLPDVMQIIQARIGAGGLGFIRNGVQELVNWLRQLADNERFISAMASGFALVAETGGRVLHVMVRIGTAVSEFVADHPEVVRMAVVLAAIVGTLGVLGGTVLAVTAGMGVFVASMTLAGGAIFSVMGMTTLAITGMTVGISGLISVGAMFYHAYQSNLGGLHTRFDQVRLVVVALSEALQHWNGDMTYISMETASKLQNAGILDFFVNMVSWIRRAQEWWTGFVAGMEAGFARINWGGITQGLRSIEASLAMIGVSLNLLDPAAQTSFETMNQRGYSFANLINNVIVPGMNLLVDIFRGGAWLVENAILPAIFKAGEATKYLLNNWEGVKGILFLTALILYPIPMAILGIIAMTNSWELASQGVLAIFRTIADVVGFIGSVMGVVGSGISGIGRGFVPPDSTPQEPNPSYVSYVSRTMDDDRHRNFNPYENGGPTYVHDTGGASTVQSPTPIQVRMAQAGGGTLTPTGNNVLTPEQMSAIAEGIARAQRGAPAPRSADSAPVPGPYVPPPVDHEALYDSVLDRRGGVRRLPYE